MEKIDKAINFAVKAHSGSFRKGTQTPYIVHPMEAMVIVATMTNDADVLAAAVLHDVVEDTPTTIDDIQREFGGAVAQLVGAESEDKREDLPAESTWRVRKQETLDYLRDKATREEKMIALGDKLSNIRAMNRDYAKLGDKLWERFNQKDRAEHAWYYGTIAELLAPELGETFAHREYVELVNRVFGE